MSKLILDCDQWRLGIIAGPPGATEDELSSLSDLDELVELDPGVVADALLAITGITCTSTLPRTSWGWEATLTAYGVTLRIEMTLLEAEHAGPFWGGFALHGCVTADELCRVAQELRDKFGSIWIHDGDCTMRTPNAFRDAVVPIDETFGGIDPEG